MRRILLAVIVLLGLYGPALSQEWDIVGVRMEPYRSDWVSVPGKVKITPARIEVSIADNTPISFKVMSFQEEEERTLYRVLTLLEMSYNEAYVILHDGFVYLIEDSDIVMFKIVAK
jgi:hypothetical protein